MRHIIVCLLITVGLFTLPSVVQAGPAEEGIALYQQKDYAGALPKLRQAAEAGHADAQYHLGWMYRHGHGVEQSNEQGTKWLRRSAEGGNAAAMTDLGFAYEHGKGITKNEDMATHWYRMAAENGNVQGMHNFANAYSRGYGIQQSHEMAAHWYRKASDNGHASAAVNLGFMHEKGNGVAQSLSEAARLYKLGAERGDVYGMTNMGYIYLKGQGVPQSWTKAASWFRQSAEKGHARGQYFLGEVYERGQGVPQSRADALIWYGKAAEQGWNGAQEKVDALKAGTPLPKAAVAKPSTAEAPVAAYVSADPTEAACQSGDAAVCRQLLNVALKAIRSGQFGDDRQRAVIYWAQQGCEAGDDSSCFAIADAYGDGAYGLKADKSAAVYYLERGCKLESTVACMRLKRMPDSIVASRPKPIIHPGRPGALNRTPDGANLLIPDSIARHMRNDLVRLARGGNDWKAYDEASRGCWRYHSETGRHCYTAGWMAEHGMGISHADASQARGFYKQACNQGSDPACARFAEMNYKGEGGPVDYYGGSLYAARLCKSGDAVACDNYQLGVLHSIGTASVARIEAAANYYLYHCEKDQPSATACFNLGLFFQAPIYNRSDDALALFDHACNMDDGLPAACSAKSSLQASVKHMRDWRQKEWERQNESRGIGGFLSDLGRGINQATSSEAMSQQRTQRSKPTRSQSMIARPALTQQDWRNFNNAVRATNNIGTGYNASCPASNPYC
ncbi:tetratricopeptide repeat protein [Algimonas porphyrae]|uniref:Beta-lactamase n=1 Tax=Algimonas porphyrae TaxID=1128113 RepID=A0ABQ5V3H0_9PROT|nr:hypothetical protein [Algimonas porphyrae]GLQ20812.1 hypothetical protein GCM10007854_17670 [Algimonas porphyrae]